MTLVWIALGAAVGAPMRYVVDRVVQGRHETVFPWGTMTVNLAGCLVLGFLVAASARLSPAVQVAAGTGFCGALTTYSTFSYEVLHLVEGGSRFHAVAYVSVSLLGGLGAVGLGFQLAAWLA